jgi:Flp pilus assembly pilin Flp
MKECTVKLKDMVNKLFADNGGAATVEFLVLTAAIAGLGLVVVTAVDSDIEQFGNAVVYDDSAIVREHEKQPDLPAGMSRHRKGL